AVGVCLIILLLTTQSYLEPFIFLATLGISILLNMGTNIIAGNPVGRISSITSSCAIILQLAIAMDYSIFLMHTYYEELKLHPR
ncbi:MAG: MMPL family transporter, partial [Clostridia bacterium]|nr:MMPL family transporter [Clostridia bacterium]